ncbi:hypothetical protein SAMD00019534_120800, partial [Acytostelium subglobosum LB1]|uniref:hypothetical protein n=1 Tax=Acytostelium subglobosum LB1 TaxID=1410327 RepID=UPI000644885A
RRVHIHIVMTSIIKFTPLSGGANEDAPPCYLLEIDDFVILLDCGWNHSLDISLLEPLKKVAHRINAILLSYPDVEHIGALPYAVRELGLTGMIYGTTPVFKMGQMFLYDLYESRMAQEEFDKFDLDDVDMCFDKKRFKELSFSQHYTLEHADITITPYSAGHMLGGSVWKITKETDTIIYAIDYNHRLEGHLEGLMPTLQGPDLVKPTHLITDARFARRAPISMKRNDKDKALTATMLKTLREGGNVLMPVDTAGRVLELLQCIDAFWAQQRLGNAYSVIFLNNVTYNVCEFAKSQLEFMSASASAKFEQKNENIFAFKNIKLCHSMNDLYSLASLTKNFVVLASGKDLEAGFSRELFVRWSKDPLNLILFTDLMEQGTLGARLLNRPDKVVIEHSQRKELEGEELLVYEEERQRVREEQRQAEEKLRKEEEERARQAELDAGDIEEKIMEINLKKNPFINRFDISREQFKLEGCQPMFPFVDRVQKCDEYGMQDDSLMELAKKLNAENDQEMVPVEEQVVEEQRPKKIVSQTITVMVRCNIIKMDYEGHCDGNSVKTIIQKIAPSKLILIRGDKDSIDELETHAKNNMRLKANYAPINEQTIDLTSETNVFKVVLKDSLVNSLATSRLMDYDISYVQARVHVNEDSRVPVLDIVPENEVLAHNSSFIGDIKMSEFKQQLLDAGFQVQFDQGVLSCNGMVYVWREEVDGNSSIQMDGVLSEEYYHVRDLLYKQFQIL